MASVQAGPMLLYRSGGSTLIPSLRQAVQTIRTPKINKLFLPFKAIYFWIWAGSASILPFLTVYLAFLGLSSVQIGLIVGLEPYVATIAAPMWASLADKYSKHKTIMLSSILAVVFVYASFACVPLLDYRNPTNWTIIISLEEQNFLYRNVHVPKEHVELMLGGLKEESGMDCHLESGAEVCQTVEGCSHKLWRNVCHLRRLVKSEYNLCEIYKNCLRNCDCESCILCNHKQFVGEVASPSQEPFGENSTAIFVTTMALLFTGRFFKSPAVPILDATTMLLVKDLNQNGIEADYGRQRLWGAVSWGLFAPIVGALIDLFSFHVTSFNQYLPAFCVFVLAYLLAFVFATQIRIPTHRPPAESISKNFGLILKNPGNVVFFLAILVTGVAVGVINAYLFLFLGALCGSHMLMGLTLTLTCVSEVPFMFFATRLIERLGHHGVVVLTLFCYALRFTCYSFLQNPWLVLPVELLHGVCFGALWPALTSYCNLMAPEGMASTMQSVASACKSGIGLGTGSMVGGVIYHAFGPRILFRGSAVLCLASAFLYWPTSTYLDRRNLQRASHSHDDMGVLSVS